MTDSESDIEIKPVQLKKKATTPNSPTDLIKHNAKKTTTKLMITDALIELKSRKGTSAHAIKKHLSEKFRVDIERLNYIIKKSLKAGVEDGTFVQLKGIGASGSFKLATVNKKDKKPKKEEVPEKDGEKVKVKKIKKVDKSEQSVEKATGKKPAMKKKKKSKPIAKAEESKPAKKEEVKVTKKKISESKEEKKKKPKKTKDKDGETSQTPGKKQRIVMKRKSIGSIIKAPKMKPLKK